MAPISWRPLGHVKDDSPESDRRQRERSKYLAVLVFLIPGMILFFAFLLIPISNSFYYSAYKWNGLGPLTNYVGFKNYDFLLGQKAFRQAIDNSVMIVILSLFVQLPLAMALALVVGRGKLPGRAIFRVILFIPYVFSEILCAYIWVYIFHPRDGLVNVLYHLINSSGANLALLANKDIALYAVFVVITWKFFGFHMILYMAALQGVPRDLEDAARIDGANEWQVISGVTLPLIGPTIRLTVYLSILGSFQQFVLIWILTEGGPANATHVLATYLYKFGIVSWRLGLGSAIAVMLFVFTISFSIIYQRVVMRRDYDTQYSAI